MFFFTFLLFAFSQTPLFSKIVRFRQPDGTIVFKQVSDTESVSSVIKSSQNSSDNKLSGIKAQSAESSSAAKSGTEAAQRLSGSVSSANPVLKSSVNPNSPVGKSLSGSISGTSSETGTASFHKPASGQVPLQLYLVMGILAVLLTLSTGSCFFIWKVQNSKLAELEGRLSDSANKAGALAAQHKASLKDHEESLKGRMIQDIAVMTKLREMAAVEDMEEVVTALFFVFRTVACAESVAVFAQDGQSGELFVWRAEGMDQHRMRVLRIPQTELCLMNLCMTRSRAVSSADSDKDAAVGRTCEISTIPCQFAYPLIYKGEARGCIAIESLQEGFNLLDGEILGLVTTASSIASMSLANLGFHSLSREELLLPKGMKTIVSASDTEDLEPLVRVISGKVYEQLLKYPDLLKNARGARPVSLLFARIHNFNEIASDLGEEVLCSGMNVFYQSMQEVVFDYDGCLSTLGNGRILAFWGGPLQQKNHHLLAVQAAMRMVSVLKRLRSSHDGVSVPELDIGVAVHSCDMLLGYLGPANRREYGVTGPGISIVEEIEALTENYGADILISETTAQSVKSDVETIEMDMVTLSSSVRSCIYRVRGFKVK